MVITRKWDVKPKATNEQRRKMSENSKTGQRYGGYQREEGEGQ